MINRLNSKEVYNPIRNHINLGFKIVLDSEDMLIKLVVDLKLKQFNPEKSRVLIFVSTRKLAETATTELKKVLKGEDLQYADKVDYYHAGLDGVEREEKYDNYNSGQTVVLIATKAFGMGMDIKNIHFIYHLGPSSSFEDFLQEIGRAGRNEEMLTDAGFSSDKPIQTKCFITKEGFKKTKDKQHKSQITWNHIKQVRSTVFGYIEKFRSLNIQNESAFPLPLDLLDDFSEYEDIKNKDTFFRIILYWLEKLEKIRLGVYIPTHLPLILIEEERNFKRIKKPEDKSKLFILNDLLRGFKIKEDDSEERIIIDLGILTDKLKVNIREIYRLLFMAQTANLLKIDRNIMMEPTITRMPELKSWSKHTNNSPIIEATFALAIELIKNSKLKDQISLDGNYIDKLINDILEDKFYSDAIFWKEHKNDNKNSERKKEEILVGLSNDFKKKRAKFAFKLIGFLPKIKHKTIIKAEEDKKYSSITQLIYNGNESKNESIEQLNQYKKNLYDIIHYVANEFIKHGTKKFNIVDLLISLDIVEKEDNYFQELIFLAKSLAYLKGTGSLVPMGIELFLLNTDQIDEDVQGSSDLKVLNEFNESNQMKKLRLLTLECLSSISSANYDSFIKEYFKCEDIGSIIKLIEEHFGEDHPNLKAFRTEALNAEKKRLSGDQELVYKAKITENLQVIAGPGSGKTHTLILRVAKLVEEEKINPEIILVLAYNRAVVVELKERLGKLFKSLGYSKLINRLKVFTFHGFVKYCLKNELEDLDFDQWTNKFLEKAKKEPGIISQLLGPIKYVFVDEFQDITTERLELLKLIAKPGETSVCVIGDPNQSIYGYERANVGDPMDPKSYYDKFEELYKPKILNLSNNYRSYPDILKKAESLLSHNVSKFQMPKLISIKKPDSDVPYCEIINYETNKIKWVDKLKDFVNAKDVLGNNRFKQIALMYRSNDEVFRSYNILQSLDFLKNIRIRVQGSKASYYKSREFQYILSKFEREDNQRISRDYINEYEKLKQTLFKEFPSWEKYLLNLFHCLLLEFEVEKEETSSYGDIIEFIKDLAYKDDGQLGKVYRNNILKILPNEDKQEIIITTMHKVKGLEFDAVLIPASYSNLPQRINMDMSEIQLHELIEEERRLYYVAYTRAKYALVAINYKREGALLQGKSFQFPEQIIKKIGFSIPEGTEKLFLGWGATERGLRVHDFIKSNLQIGDKLELKRTARSWSLNTKGRVVGYLSGEATRELNNKVNNAVSLVGFSISGIYVFTYQDSLASDERNTAHFSDSWEQLAKERGYVYVIDFSGYGQHPEKK